MTRRALIPASLFAALLIAAPSAGAAPTQDPSLSPAGKYTIDPAHTRIQWRISHLGFSFYNGWFAKFDATLNFDPTALEKSRLDASVVTSSVFTLDPKFNEEIGGATFLDSASTDPITFKSTALTRTGTNTGTMTGDLTLHGVTRPVTFAVTMVGGGQSATGNAYVMGFTATATIKRSEFGVTKFLDYGLGDEVLITIDTEFDQKGD